MFLNYVDGKSESEEMRLNGEEEHVGKKEHLVKCIRSREFVPGVQS